MLSAGPAEVVATMSLARQVEVFSGIVDLAHHSIAANKIERITFQRDCTKPFDPLTHKGVDATPHLVFSFLQF